MRFAYINFFCYYLLVQLGFLFDNERLISTGTIVTLVSWGVYIAYHVKEVSRLKRCSLKDAVYYYLRFTPCMPNVPKAIKKIL